MIIIILNKGNYLSCHQTAVLQYVVFIWIQKLCFSQGELLFLRNKS